MFLNDLLAKMSQQPAPAPRKTKRKRPAKPALPTTAQVILALVASDSAALSISELAYAMGVSVGEASKRVKAIAPHLLNIRRQGKFKMVSLVRVPHDDWRSIVLAATPRETIDRYVHAVERR